jgi:hypothetical protein
LPDEIDASAGYILARIDQKCSNVMKNRRLCFVCVHVTPIHPSDQVHFPGFSDISMCNKMTLSTGNDEIVHPHVLNTKRATKQFLAALLVAFRRGALIDTGDGAT